MKSSRPIRQSVRSLISWILLAVLIVPRLLLAHEPYLAKIGPYPLRFATLPAVGLPSIGLLGDRLRQAKESADQARDTQTGTASGSTQVNGNAPSTTEPKLESSEVLPVDWFGPRLPEPSPAQVSVPQTHGGEDESKTRPAPIAAAPVVSAQMLVRYFTTPRTAIPNEEPQPGGHPAGAEVFLGVPIQFVPPEPLASPRSSATYSVSEKP